MTPVNLADRPTNVPLPVGSVQRTFAAPNATTAFPAAGTVLGTGTALQIAVTPPRRCFWVVTASLIQYCTAGWVRNDWGLRLTPADLNGRSVVQCAMGLESGGNWQFDAVETNWYLEANTAYVCAMVCYIQGANCNYYQSEAHTNIFGYTIGDGNY